MILSGDSSATLAHLAADLRTFISSQIIEYEDLRLAITASAGLTLIQDGDTLNRVYERADEGLYRSKKAGRNRGHWLDKGEWKPFPGDSGSDQELNPTLAIDAAKSTTPNCIDENKSPIANAPQTTETAQTEVDDSSVLDLAAFVERLDTQLKQLGRADMPAAAMMVEAIGLAPQLVRNFDRSWASVLEIVQVDLRGIDSVCRLRKNTLCIFMPGYNLNAALERAGGMQHMLEERRADSEGYPERFAISAGCAQVNESAGIFLQRLEDALEEAQDAAVCEVVACESTSTYFHAT